MGFKSSSSAALFLSLNLLLFACTIASDCGSYCSTPTNPTPKPHPAPSPVDHTPSKPTPKPHPTPSPVHTPVYPKPTPAPAKCPRDTLKIGACANLLGGLLGAIIGHPPSHPCCTLIYGLVDAQAAVCLCTAHNRQGDMKLVTIVSYATNIIDFSITPLFLLSFVNML